MKIQLIILGEEMKKKIKSFLYYFYTLLIFVSEYVLGTIFVLIYSYILIKTGSENFISSYDLSVVLSKLTLLSFILILSNKIKFKFLLFNKVSFYKIFVYLLISVLYTTVYVLIFQKKGFYFSFNKYDSSYFYLLSIIFISPIYEEILYRGIGIEYMRKKGLSNLSTIIFTSLIFALIHLPSIYQMIDAFLLGLVCSIVYVKERNLAYPIIIHFVYNILITNIVVS